MKNPYNMTYKCDGDVIEITTPRKKEKLFYPNSISAEHTKFGIKIKPKIGPEYTVDEWGIRHW